MKKTAIIFLALLLNLTSFTQAEWKLSQEQKSQFIENLSSAPMGIDAFSAGGVTSSLYAQHVNRIDEWQISRDHIATLQRPHDVFVLNEEYLWVCGDKGMISHSDVRGNEGSWAVQATPTDESLKSIWFTDLNNGWAVGNNATILNTKDGGQTWIKAPSPLNMNFIKVIFTDQNNGYILADRIGSDYKGRILKTTNGGVSWSVYTFDGSIQDALTGMHFYDSQNGWICGMGGFITHTGNGGKSWTMQQRYLNGLKSLNDIHFRTLDEGWACGLRGLLYHTTNGGKTWTQKDIGEKFHFTALEFNGPYLGWLATAGKIYQYKDPRFEKYRDDYKKNGPPKVQVQPTNPTQTQKPPTVTVHVQQTKPQQTSTSLFSKTNQPAFTSLSKGSGWEIRTYPVDPVQIEKACKQISTQGGMPAGLNLNGNKMDLLLINKQPFKCSGWTLKTYSYVQGLSDGITSMIESGYLPLAMTLAEKNFNVLYAKTPYTGHGWQITESELDHQNVANDIQAYLQDGYIPVGISIYAGYYYTLLVQPNEFPANNWSLQGYNIRPESQMRNDINKEASGNLTPFGLLQEESIVNILYLGF